MKSYFIRAVLYSVTALICSCHPAKQLQKQDAAIDELKAKWIGDYILSHPCPSIPEINLDSLCALYRTPPNADTIGWIDQRRPTDSVESKTITTGTSTQYLRGDGAPPQRILVPWEDTRQLNLLKDSLRIIQQRMAGVQGSQSAKAEDCSAFVASIKKEEKKWIWLFIAACVIMAGAGAWSLYAKFKNPLKLL